MSETATVPATQKDIDLAIRIGVPPGIINALTPVQKGWLSLASSRIATTEELTKTELAVQQHLLGIKENNTLAEVQEKIKLAKEEAASGKECRLNFTRKLDEKLINPLMEYEKRNEDLIKDAAEHEKVVRINANKNATAAEAKNTEKALLKAHLENENLRIKVEYVNTLNNRINFYYTEALRRKTPATEMKKYCEDIFAELPQIEVPKATKFERTLVTVDEAMEIYNSITPYVPQADLVIAQESIKDKFEMYAHDLKSADEAIAAANENTAKAAAETQQAVEIDSSLNILAAKAQVASFSAGSGAKTKVKTEMKIIIHENDDFLILLLTNFLKRFDKVKQYLKVKSVTKLTVQQMADALSKHVTETGEVLVGLQTEKVEK